MITTKTTAICDRCGAESTSSINHLKLNSIPVTQNLSPSFYFPHTTGIAFNHNEYEGWHLCDGCLRDFRRFVEKVTIKDLENTVN